MVIRRKVLPHRSAFQIALLLAVWMALAWNLSALQTVRPLAEPSVAPQLSTDTYNYNDYNSCWEFVEPDLNYTEEKVLAWQNESKRIYPEGINSYAELWNLLPTLSRYPTRIPTTHQQALNFCKIF